VRLFNHFSMLFFLAVISSISIGIAFYVAVYLNEVVR